MQKDLIIIGAGGFAREVMWLVDRINAVQPTWNLIGFMDDCGLEKTGRYMHGYPILNEAIDKEDYPNVWYVCAIGSAEIREKVVAKYQGGQFATLIDPGVVMSESVSVGEGSILCAGTVITVDVTIGRHVIVNLDCTVGHDVSIKDFVTINPSVNVSGGTVIDSVSEIGTGAQIIQNITVGSHSIVGAGAVVIRDIPSDCTAVGNPAKSISFFSREE